MSARTNARQAALETLMRCRRDGAWSGASLDGIIRKYDLDRRDAAFASRLVLSVLENAGYCDFLIGCYSKGKLEPQVRDILRLGTAQLLFLDRVPASAAVNESVSLCRQNRLQRAAGLVNAVLRKIADNRAALPEVPGKGTAEYLAVRYSHPLWVAQELVQQKGYDFTEAFFAANNEPAPLNLQVNTLKVSAADYARALARTEIPYTVPEEPEGCLLLDGGVAQDLPGFEDGLFYVQDRAARMAVEFVSPAPGMRVLDACACPGGKSFAAAIRMENRGSILACDIHEKKLGLLKAGAERLGVGIIETRAMDARVFEPALEGAFDLVIADVPCSGFGVIRKKPEIRYKEKEEIEKLTEIQLAILENLSRYVSPGGTLLYSTCTVLEQENEAVVRAFLKAHPAFEAKALKSRAVDESTGMYTFWPHVDGTDGFFAAAITKNKQ
ncbi:MAG: 16S rRNA (cytosine(967)-C(5))-methyltransferase RsmB [Oscillospiraceae bacterium]|nr:16S rRNA (cytosine(967)-C(5))-methyltransferase RsmB [Oscillospiraceae bacterium]